VHEIVLDFDVSSDAPGRFMGLNDLMSEIKQDQTSFIGDEPTETKVLKQVLSLVEDRISEVKNQAVKWYARTCCYYS
jgi:cullin-associated NEDD8-dissociated protein 1